jgi:hypothetical protein
MPKKASSIRRATPNLSSQAASAGYSGTPLPKKLGLKSRMRVLIVNAPANLPDLLSGAAPDIFLLSRIAPFDCALVFSTRAGELAAAMERLERRLAQDGMIWAAWPKKTSGTQTDLVEDVVRRIGLGIGLVDVKVCAIDATWSGLKFVRRLKDRR